MPTHLLGTRFNDCLQLTEVPRGVWFLFVFRQRRRFLIHVCDCFPFFHTAQTRKMLINNEILIYDVETLKRSPPN